MFSGSGGRSTWLLVVLSIVTAVGIVTAAPAYAASGDLDMTFNGDGKVITDFGGGFDEAEGVAIQPDGKTVAAGRSGSTGTHDFALARYRPDGRPDRSFGGDGKVTTDFGSGFEGASGVAIQPDGKIVAAGVSNGSFALARYNTNGRLDSSFGTNGKVITDFFGFAEAFGVAIQPDGKIVAAGRGSGARADDFALARYNADGSLDTTFSDDGKVTTDFVAFDGAFGVAIQPDGKIVAAGVSNGATDAADFALARYNADGSLDTTFSDDGKVTTDFGDILMPTDDRAADVAIQPDGKIVAAGSSSVIGDTGDDFALARYNADGSLDTTFSDDGKVTTDFVAFDGAFGVAIQPDGKIVAAGRVGAFEAFDFALARYLP